MSAPPMNLETSQETIVNSTKQKNYILLGTNQGSFWSIEHGQFLFNRGSMPPISAIKGCAAIQLTYNILFPQIEMISKQITKIVLHYL